MKKRFFALLIVLVATLSLAGCGGANTGKDPSSGKVAGIALPIASDEFFKFIGDSMTEVLEAEGYEVQITSADSDNQKLVSQIQNFVQNKVDILYVFASGEPELFEDPLKEAKEAGIKTIVSHNSGALPDANVMVQADEFIMGTMMAPMVSKWIDRQMPNAGVGEVKALALEQSMIPDMVKRSVGMKIIGEKFLRKVDLSTGKFVKYEGDKVLYKDENGNEAAVDEPTGGLIIKDGFALLNPFYDERVTVLEINNRTNQSNMDVQNSLDAFFASDQGKEMDVDVLMVYGGDGAVGGSEKLLNLVEQGRITKDLSDLAVFGADITESNIERIKQSKDNKSLVRGVMTNGNIIETLKELTGKLARGEDVPHESWEDLGFMMLNDDQSDIEQVIYNNQLPETSAFFD